MIREELSKSKGEKLVGREEEEEEEARRMGSGCLNFQICEAL